MAIEISKSGTGKISVLHSDNKELMLEVFSQVGLKNLKGTRLNFAIASFNRAFAKDRNNFESNMDWFKSLLGK